MNLQKILIVVLIIAMIVFEMLSPHLFPDSIDAIALKNSMQKFLGGTLLAMIFVGLGYSESFRCKKLGRSILIVIPAILLSLYNFPMIAFLDGRAIVTEPTYRVYLFLLECSFTGYFEEIIFRGILLTLLVQLFAKKNHGIVKAILLSSLLFGLSHVINLFSGASLSSTVLQVGYSFLLGCLWAVMYLKTNNLWVTMFLHATYNFFGQVLFQLGTVEGRFDVITIVSTTLLAVLVAIYAVGLLKTLPSSMNNESKITTST